MARTYNPLVGNNRNAVRTPLGEVAFSSMQPSALDQVVRTPVDQRRLQGLFTTLRNRPTASQLRLIKSELQGVPEEQISKISPLSIQQIDDFIAQIEGGNLRDSSGLFNAIEQGGGLNFSGSAPLQLFTEGTGVGPEASFSSIDELIEARTDPAIDILRGGSQEQLRLAQLATQEGVGPLEELIDLRALEERSNLLGLGGQEAQQQAISSIPVSDFDRQQQERQRKQFLRQANAAGDLGSGASLLAASQLAGAQQADLIQRRLEQLEPLVAASRGLSSSVSQLREQGRVGESQIQSGLGTQIANIRLGAVAPQIQARQEEAELAGLRGIASSNRSGQTLSQIAGFAGNLLGGLG